MVIQDTSRIQVSKCSKNLIERVTPSVCTSTPIYIALEVGRCYSCHSNLSESCTTTMRCSHSLNSRNRNKSLALLLRVSESSQTIEMLLHPQPDQSNDNVIQDETVWTGLCHKNHSMSKEHSI